VATLIAEVLFALLYNHLNITSNEAFWYSTFQMIIDATGMYSAMFCCGLGGFTSLI